MLGDIPRRSILRAFQATRLREAVVCMQHDDGVRQASRRGERPTCSEGKKGGNGRGPHREVHIDKRSASKAFTARAHANRTNALAGSSSSDGGGT